MGNVDGEYEFHAGEMVVDLSHPFSYFFFPVGNGLTPQFKSWSSKFGSLKVPCV